MTARDVLPTLCSMPKAAHEPRTILLNIYLIDLSCFFLQNAPFYNYYQVMLNRWAHQGSRDNFGHFQHACGHATLGQMCGVHPFPLCATSLHYFSCKTSNVKKPN